MIKNIILTTLRQLRKNPGYSALNIIGLSVGMACFILIFLWLQNEWGYDRCFENADHIYRVNSDVNLRSGQKRLYSVTATGMAKALREDFPEVEAATRWLPFGQAVVGKGDLSYYERGFAHTESSFFEVFNYPLLSGDPAQVLKEPNSLVLTREMAHKYFGDDDPIGKTLTFNNLFELKVTGILGEVPANSHIRPSFLAYPGEIPLFNNPNWMGLALYTYVRLKEGTDAEAFEEKIQSLAEKHCGPRGREIFQYRLLALTSIHLHSNREQEIAPQMDVVQVYLLSAVAILILIVACINFVNLSTARSGRRAREVGVRKVLGAQRPMLTWQYILESVLSSLIAFVFSLLLVRAALPSFNALSEVQLELNSWILLAQFLGIALGVGVLSGCYPALILSSFQPGVVLRTGWLKRGSSPGMRRALIVFQFAVTVVLLIATGVVSTQMRYVRNKNLGFQKDQVLSIRVRNQEVIQDYEAIKQEWLSNPSIQGASFSSSLPGFPIAQRAYIPEAFEDNALMLLTLYVDQDFISTMGIDVIAGRDFNRDFSTDTATAYIINEAAQKKFGWENALGKRIECTNADETDETRHGTVIGVVRDFHLRSLHQEIEPVLLRIRPDLYNIVSLKLSGRNLSGAMDFLEGKMATLQPNYPFEYWFLDSQIDSLYRNEQRLGRIFTAFSIITVLVACLGLIGLAAFMAEQRTKEIGIRKVHGAPVSHIVWLLVREFAGLVLISNIIAWPAAYLIMERWLQNFSYRTQIPLLLFAAAGAVSLAIALCTVSSQAMRAAAANPIQALRHE
jgi:putative ABC transport system permease protein